MKLEKVIFLSVCGGVTLIGLGASLPATAAVLVDYQFTGNFSPTNIFPNVTADDINRTGSSLPTFGLQSDNLAVLSSPGVTNSTTAVTQNQYFQFSVTPNANFEIDLTSLTFDARRVAAQTRGWVLRSSIDNFAANIATADIPTTGTFTPVSVLLSGASFQNLTSSVTFRIYNYSAGGLQSVLYDNITLNGTVSSLVTPTVPEPSSMVALLSLAAIGGGALVKRRIGK